MRSRPFSFSPEAVFLILGLLAGGLLCVFIPFGAGFDEETHLVRVYDLAGLHLLPNRSAGEGSYAPGEFFSLSYQRRALLTPAQDLLQTEAFSRQIDRDIPTLTQTRSVYPPPGLAVQAVLARLLWLKYDLPLVAGTILLRLAGLGVYLLGAWLAVRWLPFGKWILVVLALAPMALFAAATVNMDGYNNALSFLFIALVLRTAVKKEQRLGWGEVGALAGLSILLGLSKPGAVLILPFLLILYRRRPVTTLQVVTLVLGALLAVALTVGWNSLALAGSHFDAGGEQSVGRQMERILADPWQFTITFLLANVTRLGSIYQDWVGVYGHWVGQVPAAIYFIYPLGLLGVLLAEPRGLDFTRRQRLAMVGIFLLAAVATELLYFAVNYAPGDTGSLGRQGRYFTPLAPLLFLACAGLVSWHLDRARRARGLSLLLLVLTLALYGAGLYATYYTYCGASTYTGKACVQPEYKNLDWETAPEIFLVPGAPLSQSFTSVCGGVVSAEVLVRSAPKAAGRLRISLLSADGQMLGQREAEFAELRAGGYLGVSADTPKRQPGGKIEGKFSLLLEQLSALDEGGPGFAAAYRDDYPGGALAIAGNERGTDLIFHYTCLPARLIGTR